MRLAGDPSVSAVGIAVAIAPPKITAVTTAVLTIRFIIGPLVVGGYCHQLPYLVWV
jgi:hypothetical protein